MYVYVYPSSVCMYGDLCVIGGFARFHAVTEGIPIQALVGHARATRCDRLDSLILRTIEGGEKQV